MRECIRSGSGCLVGRFHGQGNIRPGHRAGGRVEPAPKTPTGAASAVRVIIWQEIYRQYSTTDRPTGGDGGGTRILRPPRNKAAAAGGYRPAARPGRAGPGRPSVKTLPLEYRETGRPSVVLSPSPWVVGTAGHGLRAGSIRAANRRERIGPTCAGTTTLEAGHSRSTIVGRLSTGSVCTPTHAG